MDNVEKLQPGYVVYIDAADNFFVIGAAEGLKYITNSGNASEFAANPTATTTSATTIGAMEPNDSPAHLYQVWWGIQDGEQYKVQVPTGTSRLGPDQDRTSTYLTVHDTNRWAPDKLLTEMWLIRNYYPAYVVYNATPYTQTPRIWFYGWMYDIKLLQDKQLSVAPNDTLLNNLRGALAGKNSSIIPFKRITIGGVKRTAGN